MFNTSTPKVTIPVDSDFLLMFVDDTGQLVQFAFAKTTVQSDLNRGLDPKLRLAVRARNVNVQARFFSGEKEEPILAVPKNGRTNVPSLPDHPNTAIGVSAHPFPKEHHVR